MKQFRILGLLTLFTLFITTISCTPKTEDLPDGLYAKISTKRGDIILYLEYEKTPMTVTNFVALAEGTMDKATRKGHFYDGLNFHRVIDNFMIQGGCPEGTGRGNPGYKFPDEFDPTLVHDRAGILSMANAGPNTNGSQFFITHGPTPHLNGKHTVFGHVVKGQDVVNSIKQGDKIDKVTIIRVGEKAKSFVANQKNFDKLVAKAMEKAAKKLEKENQEIISKIKTAYPNIKLSKNGIYYTIETDGKGLTPKKGETVSVHYTGSFMDGTVFDSSIQRGTPIEFPVGTGRVIPGWDQTLLNMNKGEKRIVFIPPNLAYGEQGYPGAIPPNSWLKFEMELIDIK